MWVVKFNAEHRILWQRAWGGTRRDFASNIIAAHGSGYIICANVLSSDGNVPGNHGGFDAWLIRIDDNGNAIWSKTFGGSRDELCSSIAKTSDGGYIVVGTSGSNDGDVSGNKGMGDGWIIKIDGPGNRVWQKTLGGSTIDDFLSVTNTLDGGYIAVGLSQSNDGDISGQHGPLGVYDTWAVKLDAAGNVQWNKMYGGTGHDRATSVVANTDGSLMIAGTSESNNGDITGNHGLSDGYLMKISANGDILWVKTFGGSKTESIYHILKTSDNYYILSGTTESPEVDFVHYKGSFDGWLIKVNATGDIIGQQLLGGSDQDKANWLVEAIVGEYVLVGSTRSNDKNIIGAAGDSEAWLMRFGL